MAASEHATLLQQRLQAHLSSGELDVSEKINKGSPSSAAVVGKQEQHQQPRESKAQKHELKQARVETREAAAKKAISITAAAAGAAAAGSRAAGPAAGSIAAAASPAATPRMLLLCGLQAGGAGRAALREELKRQLQVRGTLRHVIDVISKLV